MLSNYKALNFSEQAFSKQELHMSLGIKIKLPVVSLRPGSEVKAHSFLMSTICIYYVTPLKHMQIQKLATPLYTGLQRNISISSMSEETRPKTSSCS